MILTFEQIKSSVKPIAEKYGLRAVYLFGSYARNEATEDSDIDLLIDRTGSNVKTLFDMGGLFDELKESLDKEIDVVTTQTLEQKSTMERTPDFIKTIERERVPIYG